MFRLLRRRATVRGPLGGSRSWTLVWALLFGARLVRRFTRGKEEVVFSHEIQPGETLLIAGEGREPRVVGGR
jgi:hypothetical protein